MWLKVNLSEGRTAWQIQAGNPLLWGSKVTNSGQSNIWAIKLSETPWVQQLHLKKQSLHQGPKPALVMSFPSNNLHIFFYFYEYSSASLTSLLNVYMPSRVFV